MMFTNEQIKDMVDLKEDLSKKISDHQEAIDSLEKMLHIIDTVLKGSSFTKASQMIPRNDNVSKSDVSKTIKTDSKYISDKEELVENTGDEDYEDEDEDEDEDNTQTNAIPIKNASGKDIIAKAYIETDAVTIIIDDKIMINENTPPFRSFFIDRVIGDIKRRDQDMVKKGEMKIDSIIECMIKNDGTNMRKIIIKNYGQNDKAMDIINAVGWSLAKMLGKSGA